MHRRVPPGERNYNKDIFWKEKEIFSLWICYHLVVSLGQSCCSHAERCRPLPPLPGTCLHVAWLGWWQRVFFMEGRGPVLCVCVSSYPACAPASFWCHPLPRAATPQGSSAPAGLFTEQHLCRNSQCQKCITEMKICSLRLVGNIPSRFKLFQSLVI